MLTVKNLLIVISFSMIFFYGCSKNNADQKEKSEPVNTSAVRLSDASIKQIGLTTEKVTFRQFNAEMKVPATVRNNQDQEAQVGSLIEGRVNKVFVKPGDFVRAGQLLMLVEGLQVGELKAHYLTTKANLEFTKANFNRQQTLIDQKAGSQKSYLEAKAEYYKAMAEFDAEDKKIHSIGLTDEDMLKDDATHTSGTISVKSPIAGVVNERNVVIGQHVDGTTTAFRIINSNSVWIDGQVYEKDISSIKSGSNAYFTSSSIPQEKFSGRVIYQGQTIDEKTRTIIVRAEFNNQNGRLKPQMFGELELKSDQMSKAIFIPAEAIVKIDNKDFVFVQKSSNEFEKREVITGITQNESVQIKDGLKENESVVTKGAFSLKSELLKTELEGDE